MTVPLVCFDSNFIIWGIKQAASAGQEAEIDKATYIVAQAAKQGTRILIPAVALGEVLSSLCAEDRETFVRRVNSSFFVAPYDTAAALLYARMWQARKPDRAHTRNETKADFLIAAIAVVNKCECIYSNDGGLCAFAAPYIKVLTLDDIVIPPAQAPLFDDAA